MDNLSYPAGTRLILFLSGVQLYFLLFQLVPAKALTTQSQEIAVSTQQQQNHFPQDLWLI